MGGMMVNGTYIMGYTDCVRGLTNGNGGEGTYGAGETPSDKGAPKLSDSSVEVNGNIMTILVTVDLIDLIHSHMQGQQDVIFAAGSTGFTPDSCSAEIAPANHHDLGACGFVGNKVVKFFEDSVTI